MYCGLAKRCHRKHRLGRGAASIVPPAYLTAPGTWVLPVRYNACKMKALSIKQPWIHAILHERLKDRLHAA